MASAFIGLAPLKMLVAPSVVVAQYCTMRGTSGLRLVPLGGRHFILIRSCGKGAKGMPHSVLGNSERA